MFYCNRQFKNVLFLIIVLSLCVLLFNTSVFAETKTRVVIDQAGRKVTIPTEVNRIVTTWRPATFMVFAVGGQEKLVGVEEHAASTKLLKEVYPEIAQLTKVGSMKGLNIEAVVSTHPDVVVIWSQKGSDYIIEQLESQGIPSVVLIPESIEQMKEAALLLGQILGTEPIAEKMVNYYDQKLEMIKERVSQIPENQRKKVYLAGSHGFLCTCSSEMFQHFAIEKAGGNDVASELTGFWNDISAEQLVKWNPDIIVAVRYCPENLGDVVKKYDYTQSINAVKSGELYLFPSNLGPWDYPEPRSILGILWLAKLINPEIFADLDLVQEIEDFHKDFFGKSYTELGGKFEPKINL